ncbi:MAG: 4,5-dihydroxyphthalate decarboxylase [Acidobacteriota bacterium]|nr:4,5-dihydroxyphthalate decarboxylase [Acidobacteriota bacterium]
MVRLSLAIGPYPHAAALRDGTVSVPGADFDLTTARPAEIFWRMIRGKEFDVSEMSLSAYTVLLSRGDTSFVGLPVFPSRIFRHSFIYVKDPSAIRVPEDLRGARIGVPEYHMTAALFIRGLLSDDHGIGAADVAWVQGGQDTPGRIERIELDLPASVTLERVQDRALVDMLVAGEIDALASAAVPRAFADGTLPIRRLFPNARETEIDWYRRTGVFPIMHLIVIRREVHEQHPWLAVRLCEAFSEAKARYYEALEESAFGLSPLPLSVHDLEFTWETFGRDFLPYGVTRNAPTLNSALRYSTEQFLSARPVKLDELFLPETLPVFDA